MLPSNTLSARPHAYMYYHVRHAFKQSPCSDLVRSFSVGRIFGYFLRFASIGRWFALFYRPFGFETSHLPFPSYDIRFHFSHFITRRKHDFYVVLDSFSTTRRYFSFPFDVESVLYISVTTSAMPHQRRLYGQTHSVSFRYFRFDITLRAEPLLLASSYAILYTARSASPFLLLLY